MCVLPSQRTQHELITMFSPWALVTTARHVLRLQVEKTACKKKIAANMLKKQKRTSDEGWSSRLVRG